MPAPIISARDIRKRFGKLEVLKGIDIDIEPGVVTTIVGPSGAGKTTLLQILGTLSQPEAGGTLRYGDTSLRPSTTDSCRPSGTKT